MSKLTKKERGMIMVEVMGSGLTGLKALDYAHLLSMEKLKRK